MTGKGDNAALAFRSAPSKARCVVQKDNLDDATRCTACGNAEMLGYACDMCEKMHCGGCLPYEVHECTPWRQEMSRRQDKARSAAPSNVPKFHSCSKAGCAEKSLAGVECCLCREAFCLRHRLEDDHDCPQKARAAEAASKKAAENNQKRSNNPFAALLTSSPLAQVFSTGNKKEAKVGNPVMIPSEIHIDDRHLLTIVFPQEYQFSTTQRVIVHKKWGVGRILQFLLDSYGKKSGDGTYILVRSSDLTRLSAVASFQELTRAGNLQRAEPLLLLPEAWYTTTIEQFRASQAATDKQATWKEFLEALPTLVQTPA